MNQLPAPASPVATKTARKLTFRRKLLFASVSVLVFLLACEAALRVRAWIKYGSFGSDMDVQSVYSPELGFDVPRPGYESHGSTASVKINSLGFRGEEITLAKPSGTVRIACIGASTTYCTGVINNESAWPYLLQELLRKKYPGVSWEVINAGLPARRMGPIIKNLKVRVLPLEPDLVIFYEAHNQMVDDTRKLALEQGLISSEASRGSATAESLARWSLVFNLCHRNLHFMSALSDSKQGKLNSVPTDLNKTYLNYLAEMHGELKARRVPLAVSPFFVKFRREQERSVQVANADFASYFMPWMSIEDLNNAFDAYNKGLVDYARANDMPVIEETTSIPGDAKHFVDCCHFSAAGCVLMANRMLTTLEQGGTLQRIMAARKQAK